MTEEIKLKYRWRKTWPDQEHDFIGQDDQETIGRFYKHRAAEGMRWYWHLQWNAERRERVQLSGLCLEPREAAREIERNYDRLRDTLKQDAAREETDRQR
jgi:hypothetical protein